MAQTKGKRLPLGVRQLPTGRFQARYVGPDMRRHQATFATSELANGWLVKERQLMDKNKVEPGAWTPPADRVADLRWQAEVERLNTFRVLAEEYLTTRDLRPVTVRNYRRLLARNLLPVFGDVPLKKITTADVRAWHSTQSPTTPADTAAAYRLLRSIMQTAEADGLLGTSGRNPVQMRGKSAAKPKRSYGAATLDEIQGITNAMPERLKLAVVLAAWCALREGEILELRRSDVDPKAGTVRVTRKVEKDRDAAADGACLNCGRVIGPPKTDAGVRTVHVPPPLIPLLRAHMLEHTDPGAFGLLFPGERKDHMSVRYLLSHYGTARATAGRDDLPFHGLRKTALTLAGREGATAAELKRRGGHSSDRAMAIYQLADDNRDREIAERLGRTFTEWESSTN